MKKSLKRLCIDSATKFLYIALYDNNECLGKYYSAGSNDHSVQLMINIEKILKNNKVKVSDLDEIYVGVGPGSYTGLRIGVVVAKMFGWNDNIDVFTVSSLALIASSSDQETLLLSEIDARRGNSFLGLYKQEKQLLSLVDSEKLVSLEEYKNSIKDEFVSISFGEPNFIKCIQSGLPIKVEDIHSLNPNYLRLTEAERNLT
jgi:tRNA threonylcarbamoyladenosine biosynthesis protein TsaB